ncbi:hypothetical protein [Methylocaldum sp. GT1TLB]|uniref:hypothetical protein n=1 Tax=Methylocaldum sp. GT1TLB TaxID=3438965 RepID=UPI003DA07B03
MPAPLANAAEGESGAWGDGVIPIVVSGAGVAEPVEGPPDTPVTAETSNPPKAERYVAIDVPLPSRTEPVPPELRKRRSPPTPTR